MRDLPRNAFDIKDVWHALTGAAVFFVLLVASSSILLADVIDGIAIVINNDAILVSEINEAMMPLIQEYRTSYAGDELKKKMAELRDTIIKQAIETKLIVQVARASGITANEKTIDTRIQAVKDRFPSEDDFLRALFLKGMTYREYRDQVAEQVLVQETIRRMVGVGGSLLDNELQEYYASHPNEFVTEARVKLVQIFIGVPIGSAPEQIELLRQKMERLRKLIVEDGADFSEIAKQHSEGPFRERGGVIGFVAHGEILPELEQTVFGLKAGEVSEIVQTTYGFHLLKALEAMPSRKIDYEEAKPFIEERVNELKRNEKYEEWIKKLREQAFIDIKL